MAVTRETLRLLRGIRILIDESVDAATDDLVRAWARAWDTLADDWASAVAELEVIRDGGEWPTRAQIHSVERIEKALDATRLALEDLTHNAGVRIIAAVPDMVAAADGHLDVIASQLPKAARVEVAASFGSASQAQIDAIVRRTTDVVVSMLRPLTSEAMAALYTDLVRGVALGDNPRTVAARLMRRLEGRFNGGLTRALVVTRTEMLDAHRAAAAEIHRANASVLRGWQWVAQLDRRTCPSCWSRHGSEHPLSEPGPEDHQQGRCARLPLTRSWRDLGLDIEEPASVVPDARAAFGRMSKRDQLQVMGPARLRMLNAGDVGWDQLAQRRTTRGWRPSWATTPVRDLVS